MIQAVIYYIVDRFKSVNVTNEFVCIDEELLLWKGRLSFKQCIPNNKLRFGIKLFSLCETSGHLWNSFVYLALQQKTKISQKKKKKRCVVYTKDDERQKISMLSMCKLPWLMSCPMLRKTWKIKLKE